MTDLISVIDLPLTFSIKLGGEMVNKICRALTRDTLLELDVCCSKYWDYDNVMLCSHAHTHTRTHARTHTQSHSSSPTCAHLSNMTECFSSFSGTLSKYTNLWHQSRSWTSKTYLHSRCLFSHLAVTHRFMFKVSSLSSTSLPFSVGSSRRDDF